MVGWIRILCLLFMSFEFTWGFLGFTCSLSYVSLSLFLFYCYYFGCFVVLFLSVVWFCALSVFGLLVLRVAVYLCVLMFDLR